MLILYSTIKKSSEYKRQILKSCKNKVKIHEIENKNQYSLTECYNKGIDLCEEDETLVLIHDDITLPYGWDEKIEKIFDTTEYGIIGVAGTCTLGKNAIWWEHRSDLCGIVSHQKTVNKKLIKYDTRFSEDHDFVMDVCCVDGVFMALRKNRIKKRFNEEITGFHFYDISFSVDNFISGVKIGVTTSFKIHHKSIGQISRDWHINRNVFLHKYQNILPISVKPNIYQIAPILDRELKPIKIGVIILTKDKIDFLIKTLDSLIGKTSKNIQLNIIIGDTGSSSESLNILQNYLNNQKSENSTIKIHFLEKYNFAKNNNEIAFKYFQEEELLLFCNNDIELVNNALDSMVHTYQNNSNCGTVGCRLLYPNLRVQHGGIVIYADKNSIKGATHFGLKSYYSVNSKLVDYFVGCTGAFLLMNREDFIKLNGFDESTIECFEDVILNIESISILNKKNYYDGRAVCIHHESTTRNENSDQLQRIQKDFKEVLIPKIIKYKEKLKNYLLII